MSNKKYNAYRIAFENAADKLQKSNLEEVKERCGIILENNIIRLNYINSPCEIHCHDTTFIPNNIPMFKKILLLHYLTSEKSIPTTGKYIGYRSLPNGMFYYSSFRKRAIDRILFQFESEPSKLIVAAKQLGGGPWEIGDYSVRVPVLPRIDVIVVFYEGDDEFPPNANMLFNDKITNFLNLEDIAVLGGDVASRLCKIQSSL